jgi:hypothetical protein
MEKEGKKELLNERLPANLIHLERRFLEQSHDG